MSLSSSSSSSPSGSIGLVVADRFELQLLVGTGGMGDVYRARDRLTGGPVALKLLHATFPIARDLERFRREAQLLADVSHPRIVRYVAHGVTAANRAYLAMEWLEGEDLAERIAREPLSIAEVTLLGKRVAEGLAVLHEKGVVHRDVKPSNIFLPGGDVQQVKVLDFGVARLQNVPFHATNTGVLVGTPGYMAPEQARGEREIDGRADVFALGCVLFEALTGRAAFHADNMAALLAKILLGDPPRASDFREDVPPELEALLARMLSKHPGARPGDGGAVVRELTRHGELTVEARPSSVSDFRDVRGLTRGERRLVSVVMAAARASVPDMTPSSPTLDEAPEGIAVSRSSPDVASLDATAIATYDVGTIVAPFSAELEHLADGTVVVTVAGRGSATDQAAHAARCALTLRQHLGSSRMSLATGLAVMNEQAVEGDVIDRAAKLLADAGEAGGVRLDATTAGLLDLRFEVTGDASGLVLRATREIVSEPRTLLGKRTPCVGRDREIAQIEALLEECVTEPRARAVLVTAPPGVGKSRLADEVVRRFEERGGVQIWAARGDPMSEGAPFSILGQAARRAAGASDGEALVVRQQRIRARVARHLGAEDAGRVIEFVGELVGTPFADAQSVQLRAARQDATLMGDQMRRAWEDWVAAECAHEPVVLVLEDLHWGDLPSIKFIDSALRNLEDTPLLVLAFARPEVHDTFPGIWTERNLQEIRLATLGKKASERLVLEVLGPDADPEVVRGIVERAAGNAFYLEELVRAVAERSETKLPDTVLAMVEARVEQLDPDARRLLRAASVFGQVFWRGGVIALLGGPARARQVDEWLQELLARELVTSRATSAFAGESEYAFRHALVREAAYAMLTPEDRVLGHRLGAEWLAEVGERSAVVLAEHFERGGSAARAVEHYRRAAAQAFEGNDFGETSALADRAIALGAQAATLGELLLLKAEASNCSGALREAEKHGRAALETLEAGSDAWFLAVGELSATAWRMVDRRFLLALADALAPHLTPVEATAEASRARITGVARLASRLFCTSDFARADPMLRWLEGASARVLEDDPAIAGYVYATQAERAMWLVETEQQILLLEKAVAAFERAGDVRAACQQRITLANALAQFGLLDAAEKHLRQAQREAERLLLASTALAAKHYLGAVISRKGMLTEALRLEGEAADGFRASEDGFHEGAARVYLGVMLRLADRTEEAEASIRRGVELVKNVPSAHAIALAMLASIQRARGDAAGALESAGAALALFKSAGGVIEGEAYVWLEYAEALEAVGNHAAACAAIRDARERLLARADRIENRAWRRSFLDRIRENARTLACAGEWLR